MTNQRTKVMNTETEIEIGADILHKTDTFLKVALDGTNMSVMLYKNAPSDRVYVGQRGPLELTSTGE